MTIEQFETIIKNDPIDNVISLIETAHLTSSITKAIKQFNPESHDVTDKTLRKDREILDDEGNVASIKDVWRIPLPIQKKIVNIAVAFLGTPAVDSPAKQKQEKNFVQLLKKIWTDNKLDYKFKKIATHAKSEGHSAELWFTKKLKPEESDYWANEPIPATTKFKFGMKIIAPSLGDTLLPVRDEFEDMIAFGRKYKIKDEKAQDVNCFDLYTARTIYQAKQVEGKWYYYNGTDYVEDYRDGVENIIGKIPVIYYPSAVEWQDVQPLIHRLEVKISNHADTNDYFDSPVLLATGKVLDMPEKGERGKLFEMQEGGDIKYVTWDNLPASMKMEIDHLREFIYSLTQTPDVSFENLKNLGYFSTVALQTMFMDAHFKAAVAEEIFGEGIQRRINYLKKAISVLDPTYKKVLSLDIKPKFEYFIPKNVEEIVNTIIAGVNAGIMSKDTAVRLNPMVDNPEDEIEALRTAAVVLPKPIEQGNQPGGVQTEEIPANKN